jgi:DNA primase
MLDDFLARLDGVKRTGDDKYIARCPAHDDRSPSLSIKEVDDRILIHCHAGCDALSIVEAVGLELSDLFDDHEHDHRTAPLKRGRKRTDYKRAFMFAKHEASVIACAASDLAQGKALSDKDRERLTRAINNLRRIEEGCTDAA